MVSLKNSIKILQQINFIFCNIVFSSWFCENYPNFLKGNGSFGVVYQARLIDTNETIAIKKVLQDKRFKVEIICSLSLFYQLLFFFVFFHVESRIANYEEVGSLQYCSASLFLLFQRRKGKLDFDLYRQAISLQEKFANCYVSER